MSGLFSRLATGLGFGKDEPEWTEDDIQKYEADPYFRSGKKSKTSQGWRNAMRMDKSAYRAIQANLKR